MLGIRPTVRGVAMNPVDHLMEEVKVKQVEVVPQLVLGETYKGPVHVQQRKIPNITDTTSN